jgi:zinc transport system substrate-binding protein
MRRRNEARYLLVIAQCFLLILLAGCGKSVRETVDTSGAKRLCVYTVNFPLKYFAERIGGDLVDVQFPGPADGDPAYWFPNADTVAMYQRADLILLNGAHYAKWVSKVSLPSARMVDTGASFADRFIEIEERVTHSHGPAGPHAHGGMAFTTWLDPKLAVEQARAVKDALERKLPDHKARVADAFAALERDLLEIDRQLESAVAKNREQPLLFSHPVYQYFERRYGLNGKSVHWEPDEAPTEEMWAELKELLGEHPARWMIWEGDPDTETAAELKEMGVESVVFDPCGNKPDTGDYLSVMRRNVGELRRVCEG